MDISMCPSTTCPSRTSCYRNKASGTRPSEWRQAWMDFDARRGDRDQCDYFDPVEASKWATATEGGDRDG